MLINSVEFSKYQACFPKYSLNIRTNMTFDCLNQNEAYIPMNLSKTWEGQKPRVSDD
jgi:hypothetical protein